MAPVFRSVSLPLPLPLSVYFMLGLLWLTVLTLLNTRRLDIGLYWQDQIIYDFRAQLVTGNRVVTCSDLIKRLY